MVFITAFSVRAQTAQKSQHTSKSGGLGKNCWVSAVYFNPRHLSGRPNSAGLSGGEWPIGNNLLLGRPTASSCCGVSGSVGTDLLLLAAIQPAEHVESAAEAATKREPSYWSFSQVN